MGGKAYDNTSRLSHEDRDHVIQQVSGVLKSLDAEFKIPAELKGKVDFGDVDFCASNEKREVIRTELMKQLSCPEQYKANGTFDHFLTLERYQVDIDYCKPDELDMLCTGSSNGDFCMIVSCFVGRKLYLCDQGLFIREQKFRVSYDPMKIAEFLGFPEHSFDGQTAMSKEYMFECIEKSRFFTTPPSYKRSRDKKRREVFSEFVDKWIDGPENIPKDDPVRCALDFFGKTDEFNDVKAKELQRKKETETLTKCKKIINGSLVKELRPKLLGKEIGEVLSSIRGGRTADEYLSYLEGLNPDQVKHIVLTS